MTALDPAIVKARFDTTGDGKDDLFYLDTNGNGLIDAAARDRNGDGRIALERGEGPFAFVMGDALVEFPAVDLTRVGTRQVYSLVGPAAIYLTVIEDKNRDGDVDDDGEFIGYFIPRF